ncbi:NAD(P)-dependent oxidoreductase [Acidobacteria bacterium ACD]|nr:MAG: NAD(P)-dependent oxidoreductase [Acidobacteriota bacterium]MCE7958532.1 NAD(P)-dependent oxidoreductase [Acidobacteria bacterium ACB2]MDL1951484.1 NAD(P)-dependent oxidoreductase [Acidobacteria bacterium ACD]
MTTDVTVLGTGLLGAPAARRLLATGLRVTVWNRTPERAAALAADGARVAASAVDALRASPVTFLFLADAAAVASTLLSAGSREALTGRTVVQMGTIGPDESRRFLRDVEEAGGTWVEAPVLGSIPEALAGTLQVMVGGTPDQLEALRPLLSRLGPEPFLAGPVGSAAALKLGLNQLIGTLTAAFATSLAWVRAEGVDVDQFLRVLRKSALHAPTFDKKLPRMLSGDYSSPNFPVKHLLKDIDLFVRAAGASGVATDLPESVSRVVARAMAMGLSDEDYSALYRAVEARG